MIATVRQVLKQKLSPSAFYRIRFGWWCGRYYLPGLAKSSFTRVSALVSGFPEHSELVNTIRGINVGAPTQMCRVMTKYGSDKGNGWHTYTRVYATLFGGLRKNPLRLFELGLGTNNPDLISNMGVEGKPGASLRGWRELFPKALVYGADIDRDTLFEEDRIRTFYCDQLDGAAIQDLWSHSAFEGGMDLIIDDGLHTFEGNVSFLDGSLAKLRPGGFYVVEDIDRGALDEWRKALESVYAKRFPGHEFALVQLPNPHNDCDNNLLIIRRRP